MSISQLRLLVQHIPSIEGVYVPNNLHLSADFFGKIASLPHLKRLNLDGSNVDDDMLRWFSSSAMIESITMVFAANVHGESLEKYSLLKELIASESGLDDKGIGVIALHCPLSRISIDGTNVSAKVLECLESVKSLRILELPKAVFDNSEKLDQFGQKRPDVEISFD